MMSLFSQTDTHYLDLQTKKNHNVYQNKQKEDDRIKSNHEIMSYIVTKTNGKVETFKSHIFLDIKRVLFYNFT